MDWDVENQIKQNMNAIYRVFYKRCSLFRRLLTLCVQGSSVNNLCKQFGPGSGPTRFISKPFDTQMILLKELLEKVEFEKNQQLISNQIMKPLMFALKINPFPALAAPN